MKHNQTHAFWHSAALCLFGSAILALLTLVCFRFHVLPSVAALLYMVIIVLISLQGRFAPAIFVSIVAICCLDYFFIKPVFRMTMAETLDVVALVAYLTTALVVTSLLYRVRKSFQEVKNLNAELRRTNEELRFEISERKQAQEALRVSEQQRAAQLAKANEALRGCLDALASVPELDDFLGQVMAAMTRQLGALSSTLRVRNFEQNTLPLEIVFQDGRVMSPAEAKYPEGWRNVSIDEQRFVLFLDQPTTITSTLDPHSPMPEDQRSYLLGLGIKTIVIIPLTSGGQLNGRLTFRFTEERDFRPEELEIARALATQASLAIQLTRLAKNARQSAVLEERNQLAGEIHDSLAQFFTGISMQLGAAREVIQTGGDNGLSYLERATELAQFGLAEARRSAFSLHPSFIEESGLIETLRKLVERSNIPGRLRCNFHADGVPEKNVLPTVRQDLLRIAQEAISNAVRHAKPTVISVNVRWDPPNLVLEVTDNGSGIANAKLANGDGFGLSNMRARAENLGAQFDVRTAAGRGTSIIVLVPINL